MSETARTTLQHDLDAIEALTDWCRANVAIPPSHLIYNAAGAVANLRHRTACLNHKTEGEQ